jgi:predicted nicotinamide N-methyase
MVPRSQIDHLDLEARIDLEAHVTDAEVSQVDIEQLATRTYRFEGWRRLTVNRFMVDHLSPVAGKTVLDLGCGYSMSPLRFAHAGAEPLLDALLVDLDRPI